MKEKIKIAVVVAVAVLTLIVVLQNAQAVETKVLFFTFTLPRATLLLGTWLIGVAMGAFFGIRFSVRRSKK